MLQKQFQAFGKSSLIAQERSQANKGNSSMETNAGLQKLCAVKMKVLEETAGHNSQEP